MSTLKKKILKHLKEEVYCHLGISKVHGIGVIAIRSIPKGVNPMRTWGDAKEIKFTHKELQAVPKSVKKELKIFCYYDKEVMEIPVVGMHTLNMAVYLNHSKKPSVKFLKNGQLITLRAIKSGEELLLDYDISFGEKHFFD